MVPHDLELLEFPKVLTFLHHQSLFEGDNKRHFSLDFALDYLWKIVGPDESKGPGVCIAREDSFPWFLSTDQKDLHRIFTVLRFFISMIKEPQLGSPGSIVDLSDMVERLGQAQFTPSIDELGFLYNALYTIDTWKNLLIESKQFFSGKNSEVSNLISDFINMGPAIQSLLKELSYYFYPSGEFKADEIPELKSLKRQINRLTQDVLLEAREVIRDHKDFFANREPTVRNGRTVLPLLTEKKSQVTGIVQGMSDSGNTLYVEPEAIMKKNNELFEANIAYEQEVLAIMRKVENHFVEEKDLLEATWLWAKVFDFFYARADFSRFYGCEIPSFSQDRHNIVAGRHPFLGKKAVPLTIDIDGDILSVIITGPNTGGKSVALKTIGLFSLMFQSAIPVPLSEASELPLYSGIYADIGDEQSIEAQLSTFSGHLTRIKTILAQSDSRSLVLLDELGSGTDPQAGGALAASVLFYLNEKGIRSVITTHHQRVKMLALQNSRIETAAMEFDPKKLEPTYQLKLGELGESHALEVAHSIGLPSEIISMATEITKGSGNRVDNLIHELEISLQEAKESAEKLSLEKNRFEQEQKSYYQEKKRFETEKNTFELQQVEESNRYLSEARREIEALVKEIREGELTKERTKNIREKVDQLTSQFEQKKEEFKIREKKYSQEKASPVSMDQIKTGMKIRHLQTGKEGLVHEIKSKKKILAAFGSLKMTLGLNDLELIVEKKSRKLDVDISLQEKKVENGPAGSAMGIDIRGKRLEEALSILDHRLEQSILTGVDYFYIIHGKGSGILQQGIHQSLKGDPRVDRFSFARPEEGGTGKTHVFLKVN